MEDYLADCLPKLSVLMVTYNHEKYIRQAVQSALDQVTTFPIEIVIGEDCSTDRTRDILLEMKQAHPNKVRLHLREKNIGPQLNQAATFAACRGEYVAMLEGDDYWTDSSKLQKQVDALEAHPRWSMCFHTTRRVYQDGSREPELYPAVWDREEATIDDLFHSNFMNTCSIVFRNGLFGPLPSWHREISPGDWATSMLNADHGPIGYVPGVMADYRIHSHGLWSRSTRTYQLTEILRCLSQIDHHFRGKYRTQIDGYRNRLVESLVAECESLQAKVEEANTHYARLQQKTNEDGEIGLRRQEREAEVCAPYSAMGLEQERDRPYEAARRRSSGAEWVRKVMRPMENFARRSRQAIGLSARS